MVTTSVRQKIIALRKFEKRERSKSAKSEPPPPDEIFWTAGGGNQVCGHVILVYVDHLI